MGFQRVEIVENLVKGLLNQGNGPISPQEFFVGVHNAFAHGECLPEADWGKDDENLVSIMGALDTCIKTAKKL